MPITFTNACCVLRCSPGDVFVHRNVGNLVPVNDINALSVLEYAVGHLGVTDIIVAGHYDCGMSLSYLHFTLLIIVLTIGAIKGATSRQTLGLLDTWLRLIKDVHRLHKDDLDMIEVSTSSNLHIPHKYVYMH